MGYTGLNGSVHTMRLRQHHQILCRPIVSKNKSQSQIAQSERALREGRGYPYPGWGTPLLPRARTGL